MTTETPNDPYTQLRRDLDDVVEIASETLRTERRDRAIGPARERALILGSAIALGYIVYAAIAQLTDPSFSPASAAVVLVVTVVIALIYFGLAVADAGAKPVARGDALAAVDHRQGLHDRLQTAAEFLELEHRTSFMAAAIADAGEFANTAKTGALELEQAPRRDRKRTAWLSTIALAAAALVVWITPSVARSPAPDREPDPGLVAKLAPHGKPDKPQVKAEVQEPKEEKPQLAQEPGRRTTSKRGKRDSRLTSEIKKTRGAMGSGQSADAASAAGASEARGAPSSQAQASLKPKKPGKSKKKKPKKRKKPNSEPALAKKPQDDSGATAGRGAASGSNKSPAASPWSSKDQVTSDDEEDLEDDEEVDDEFDNSDARGGVQPHLRDRRPPVNRDLGIGFGNQKNPDANGRGGPSELKKSRGVAALVLGVPIPDHVKGRPGPGKTKITQERVEPRVEDTQAAEASARRPRQAPVGHLARPELEPWMRALLRRYYQLVRKNSTSPSPKHN